MWKQGIVSMIIHYNENMLTKREEDILKLVVEGYTNENIANILYISISTCKKHVANIFKKTKVTNRTQLTKIYYQMENKNYEK